MEHADIAPCHMRVCSNATLDLFPDVFERGHEITDLGPAPTIKERPGGKSDCCVKMHYRVAWPEHCQRLAHNLDTAEIIAEIEEGCRHQLQGISSFDQRQIGDAQSAS